MASNINELINRWEDEPGNLEAFQKLESAYADASQWRELVELHRKGGARFKDREGFGEDLVDYLSLIREELDDKKEENRLLVALGDAHMQYMDNREEAMKAYQTAFKTYPYDTECLDRARAIYRRDGDFERVLLLYKLELKVKTDSNPRADVLLRMAQVNGDDLRAFDRALELISQAKELVPDHALAHELEQVYTENHTIYAVVQELVRDARDVEDELPEEAAELLVRAAQIEWDREAGNAETAVEYAEAAYRFAPANSEAKALLAALLKEVGREAELDQEGSAGVAVMAPMQLEQEESVATESEPDVNSTQRLSVEELEANLSDDFKDAQVYESEASEAEDESEVEEESESSGGHAEDLEDVKVDEESAGESIRDTVQNPAVAASAAGLEEPSEPDDASVPTDDAGEGGIEDDPANIVALRAFKAERLEEGDVDAVIAQYETSVKLLRKEPAEAEVMADLAALYWHEKEDWEQAEFYYKRLKLLDPAHREMQEFYEAYYEQEGEWRKLSALLSGAAQNAEDPEDKLAITRRLADLAEGPMESPKIAIDAWKSYLRDVDGDAVAIEELRRLYRQEEKWSAYADLLKDDLKRIGDDAGEERLPVLDEMVTVYEEHLGLEPMVIVTLQEIISIDAAHPGAFEKLRELLEKGRRFNDLAQLMESRADAAIDGGDNATAISLLLEVADIWQDRLKNVTQALPHLERILELDPDNQDVVERLEAVYDQRRDYASLFDLRRRQAARLQGEERLARLKELAELAQEKIRDPHQIAPILEEVAQADPSDLETLETLDQIYVRVEDWEKLADVLARSAELSDGESRIDKLDRLARIQRERLEDVDAAVQTLKLVLADAPEHPRALAGLTDIWIQARNFEELESLYRERGDLDRLYDLLDSAAATTDEVPLKRTIYRRMADIAQEDLEDADRVIISLESLREFAEDEAVVARELLDWYVRTEDLGQQVAMNKVLLEHATEDERYAILESLRALEVERGDIGGALEMSLRALRQRPVDEDAFAEAVRMAARAETFEPVVDTLDEIAQGTDDDAVRALAMERAGGLLIDSGDHTSAAPYFEALREHYPDEPRYLGALETVYGATGESSKRIGALREQIRLLTDQGASKEDLIDELSKVADIQREELGEPEAARETYHEILDIEPEHLPSIRGLKALYRTSEEWQEVVDSLLRELGLVDLDDLEGRLAVQMELADVYRLYLGESAQALRYYGQILTEDPHHAEAVDAVESMLSDEGFARDAALLLEPIFRESANHEALARALEARRAVTDDRFEEAEILDELIPIYMEKLDDQDVAYDRAQRQFELDPDRQEIWLRLEQLGARQNRWADLEAIFSRFVPDANETSQTRFELLRHLAAIREHQLGMKEEALEAWKRLHDNDPYDLANVEALERLHRTLGNHRELVEALEQKANLQEDMEDKVATLVEAAQIADDIVADAGRTVELYRQVLLIEQDHAQAVSRIRAILRDEASWADLEDLLLQQADLATDPDTRRGMQLEMAQVRWRHLGEYDGAVDLLRELLFENPDSNEVVAEIGALDDQLEEMGDRDDLRLTLAELVEPFHRAAGNVGPLVETLGVKLGNTIDPFDRVRLLDEIAELRQTRMGQPEPAFEAIAEAVKLMPDEPDRRERFEHLAGQLGRVEAVVETYRDAAAEAGDPFVAAELYQTAGRWLESKLERPEEAIESYESAREQNEGAPEVLNALDRLYLQVGDHEMLAENLRRQTVHGDPGRRAEFFRRIANIEDELLGRPEEAIEAWNEVLNMEPSADDAVAALERLYSSEARWIDLTEILSRKASAAIEPENQIATLLQLATVREEKLDDVQAAIGTFNEALAVDPKNTAALGELERLYRQELQWADLADVLGRMLEVDVIRAEPALVTRIELDLADVLARELFEQERALEIYRSVLGREPGNPDAVSALERLANDDAMLELAAEDLIPIFVSTERFDDLIDLYERLQEKAVDPHERAEHFHRISQVYSQGLDDPNAALEALSKAWQLNVEKDAYRDEILLLVSERSSWGQLAQIYGDVLVEMNDPDRMLDTRMRLANLYRDQLDDPTEAEVNYREALMVDDRHLPAYDAIEQLLMQTERWHDLIDILESRYNAVAIDDEEAGRQILFRIASIQEEMLDDGFTAVESYRRALDLDPSDLQAHQAISRLFRTQERWEDLSSHIQSSLGVTDDPDLRRERTFELAEIQRVQLMNESLALDLYREILAEAPDHEGAVSALEELFADDTTPVRLDVAQVLEPIYRDNEDWESLSDVLLVLAQPDDLDGGNVQMLGEAAQIVEQHLGDPDRAHQLRAEIVRANPADDQAREALERLTAANQKWPALAEVYADILRDNLTIGDDVRIELYLALARIQENRLGQVDEARDTLENVLSLDPENNEALDALERVYSRQADWHSLGDLYRRRADFSTMPEDRRKWLEHLANLYEEVLEDPQSTIDIYVELTELDPDDRISRRALERLLQRHARWHDLADLYRQQAETAEDPYEARERWFRLAQLMEGELEQLDEALDLYESILVDAPTDLDTRRALTGLERDLQVRDGDWSDYRIRIIDLLLRTMEEPRDRDPMISLLESKEQLVQDVDDKVRIFVKMAGLMEGSKSQEDKAYALTSLANAFRIEPRNSDLADRITMLAQETDAWERLLPIYLSGLEITDEPEVQVALLNAVAKIYSGPMNDQGSAISAYQQIVEIQPDADEALGHLQRLYGELELWAPLVKILEARLDAVYDGDVQRSLLERIGRIYREVLEQPEDALEQYERLREIDPSDTRYTQALEDLYREAMRWDDLVDLLREKVAIVESPQERAQVWRDLARVHEQMLGQPEDAIDSHRAILDENPDDTTAIQALSRLYEKVERWPELLDILQIERDFASGLEELNAIELRTGNVLLDRLDAPVDAMGHFVAVLERDPAYGPAREAMARLLARPETRADAMSTLEGVMRASEEWRDLESLYEQALESEESGEARSNLYGKLAAVQENNLESAQLAFVTYGRGLREYPDNTEFIEELERLADELDNRDELVAVYEDCVESDADPMVLRDLHARLGAHFMEVEENTSAIEHWQEVMRLDEYDAAAIDALDQLYQMEGRYEELVDVLERAVATVDPDQVSRVRYRLGYLKEIIFESPEEAFDIYSEVLATEPRHANTLEAMERLVEQENLRLEAANVLEPWFQESEAWQRLENLYQLKLEVVEDPIERARILELIANLEIERFDRVEVGYAYLCRALRETPDNIDVQGRLESLVHATRMYEELVALYEEIIDDLTDPMRVVELGLVAARLLVDRLEQPGRAAELYERILDIDAENQDALGGLEAIARAAGDSDQLIAVLRRKADVLFDPDLQRDVYVELGRVYMDLEDFPEAIEVFRQALLIDESDTAVMQELIECLEITERYDELVEQLQRLAAFLDDDAARFRAHVRVGQISRVLLGNHERAIAAYEEALALDPKSVDVLDSLRELYEEAERWDLLRETIRRVIPLKQDAEEVIGLLVQLARVSYDRFNEVELAIDAYRQALEIAPGNRAVFKALDALLRGEARYGEVLKLYEDAIQATPTADVDRMVALQVEMADISAKHLGDLEGAITYLTNLLEADPNHVGALRVLAGLYGERGDAEAQEATLARMLSVATTNEELAEAHGARGDLYRSRGQVGDAAGDYVKVLEYSPTDQHALTSLREIYSELQAWGEFYQIIDFEAAYLEDPDKKLELYLEMADIAKSKLNDPARRVAALEKARAIRDDLDVLEPLLDAYISAGQVELAEPLLEAIIDNLTSERRMKDVVRFYHLQGKLAEQKGDEAGAHDAYLSAHKIDASYIPNLISLGKLLYRAQDWDESLKIFQTLLLHQMSIKSDDEKVDVYYHLGMVRLNQGDGRRAKDMFNRALNIDSDHGPSREALQQI